MSVPLFRTSLLRSTRVLHGSVPNVSRTLGTLSSNKLVRVVLPSRLAFVCSRSFITPTIALAYAAAAKSASAKKGTTTAKGRTVAKKKAPAKKKIPAKKKVVSKKKKVVSKKKVVAKKKPVKAKRKKVEKPKAPRIFKRDWLPPFKKPMGAWTKFAVEFTKERSGGLSMDLKEGLRTASTKWKNMSEEEKAAYAPPPGDMEEYSRKLAEWNADLSKKKPLLLKAKRKYKRARRSTHPIVLNANAQYIKEQFHQADYPPDVNSTILKLQHLAKTFVSEVTDEEKAGLRQRAEEEYKKKIAALG